MTTCPFCGCEPYEYVDNGVGMEPVAVTCCDLAIELFRREPGETVTISYGTFEQIADVFRSMRKLGMSPEIEP